MLHHHAVREQPILPLRRHAQLVLARTLALWQKEEIWMHKCTNNVKGWYTLIHVDTKVSAVEVCKDRADVYSSSTNRCVDKGGREGLHSLVRV